MFMDVLANQEGLFHQSRNLSPPKAQIAERLPLVYEFEPGQRKSDIEMRSELLRAHEKEHAAKMEMIKEAHAKQLQVGRQPHRNAAAQNAATQNVAAQDAATRP